MTIFKANKIIKINMTNKINPMNLIVLINMRNKTIKTLGLIMVMTDTMISNTKITLIIKDIETQMIEAEQKIIIINKLVNVKDMITEYIEMKNKIHLINLKIIKEEVDMFTKGNDQMNMLHFY